MISPPSLASSFPPDRNFSKRASFSNNFSSRPQRWVTTRLEKAPEHYVQVKSDPRFSFFGNQARELENLSLDLQARFCMFVITDCIGKTCPFREIPVKRPDREGVLWKNRSERSEENYIACIDCAHCNTMCRDLWWWNYVQESCNHSSEAPTVLGVVLTFEEHEFTWITHLQPTNLQDTACRIDLADLGLNFHLVKSSLLHWGQST